MTLVPRGGWLLGSLLVLSSCAPTVSLEPLHNAEPEGHDVYYHGDASHEGKVVPSGEPRAERPALGPASDAPAKDSASDGVAPATNGVGPTETAAAGTQTNPNESAALPSESFKDLPGTYLGSDTVTIRIDGDPERVEKDDKARLIVDPPKDGKYAFRIVDSGSGADLCSVHATISDEALHFEPGQTCLQDLLGLSMEAKLKSGTAQLLQGKLTVDYEVELEVDTPSGTQDGTLGYHFEGQRQ